MQEAITSHGCSVKSSTIGNAVSFENLNPTRLNPASLA
jgi:hypothetical protein